MRIATFLLIFFSYCCNANELPHGAMPNPAQYNYSIWLAKHLDISDGVQSYEARIIADTYFITGVSGCGIPDKVQNEGEYWVFSTLVGFSAKTGPKIKVHKTTGMVMSEGEEMSFKEIQEIKLLDLPKIDFY